MSNMNNHNEEFQKNNREDNEKSSQNSLSAENKENQQKSLAEEPKKKSFGKEVAEWIQALAIAALLAFVIQNFVLMVVRVDGDSMESTLSNNDRMIVWKLWDQPERGDIVIVKSAAQTRDQYWIKRVIATGGQTVTIDYDKNIVKVNGKELEEPYINNCHCIHCAGDPMIDIGFEKTYFNEEKGYYEYTVPKDCVFVMGDNRNHSSDSRVIESVSVDSIEGEAILRFWPLNEISVY